MDKKKFEAGFKALAIALCYDLSKEDEITKLRVYYNCLNASGCNDEMYNKAIQRMMQTYDNRYGRSFPTTSDFLDVIGISVPKIAEKAYTFTYNEIKFNGYDKPPRFKNKHTHNVAKEVIRRMGGWVHVAQLGYLIFENNKSKFISMYEDIYFSEPPETPLLGTSDLRNQEFLAEYNKNQIENKT